MHKGSEATRLHPSEGTAPTEQIDMQDTAFECREDGSRSIFIAGTQYRRDKHSYRWLKRTPSGYGYRPVSDRRARRLERIYRHRDEIKRIRRFPRLEPELKRGLPVYHPAFGSGEIDAIEGEKITVKFGGLERRVRARDLVTRVRAEVDWHSYWLRGEKRRLKEGKLLWIIKSVCRFGEWQAFLRRYDYPRTTADDLIRRYLETESNELHGNRAIDVTDADCADEHTPDPNSDEIKDLVTKETDKRRGRKPRHHPTFWSLRIKLPREVATRCRKKYKEESDAAKEFWQAAAYRFVGLDPDEPNHNSESRDDESESNE